MNHSQLHRLTLNLGHALNHFFILIYPTVVLTLQKEWDASYSELLRYGSLGVLAYGLGSLPSGWLGDHWSRSGMMKVFFFGMGLSSVLTGLAQNPLQISVGVVAMGLFASIYHPVGTALVFSSSEKTGRGMAINGLFGNMGLAIAAFSTALLSDLLGWQAAFVVPGIICVLVGTLYCKVEGKVSDIHASRSANEAVLLNKQDMTRLFLCIAVIACLGGLVFQSVSTALPKIVESAFSFSLMETGLVVTGMTTLAALVQLLIGELLDRFSARIILMVIVSSQASTLLLLAVSPDFFLLPLLCLLLFTTFAQIPVNDWLIGHYSAEEWRSRFYAMKYMLALGMAAVAYWLIAAVHGSTGSFVYLYWILGGLMGGSAVAAWLIPQQREAVVNAVS